MTKFNIHDLEIIRSANISPTTLQKQIGAVLENSNRCRAVVESLNRQTGEYRIWVQGTLETRDN
ncbi:MAG: hypothetical protein ONB16_02915 [candidate division KSB1 bacterium]|nr:hypothetical protein [candidate division KSB1 bacterium]MDZ7318420.1 hypothetical protein [candidate division KSB1 bacterium]MDZ7341250.1 hypothetical protein [candidate division KSB1 bacterium]